MVQGLGVAEMHAAFLMICLHHMPDHLTYWYHFRGSLQQPSCKSLMGNSKLNSDIAVHILMDGASKCGKFDIARALTKALKGIKLDAETCSVTD